MGSYLNIHLGPYIIVKGTKKITVDKTVNTCIDIECQAYKNNQKFTEAEKFCSKCGSSTGIKKYQEDKFLNARDLYFNNDEHTDTLHHTGHNKNEDEQVFKANHVLPLKFEDADLENCEYDGADVREVDFEKEIQIFKDYYKDVLDMFKAELGENCIEYKWGLLSWYY